LRLERDQREREKAVIAKRIEALYLEAVGGESVGDEIPLPMENDRDGEQAHDPQATGPQTPGNQNARRRVRRNPQDANTPRMQSRTQPLDQLAYLQDELSRQQHWIKRRSELKHQDHQLKKQQSSLSRGIERSDQQRRSIWAKCGVATPEQFYSLVDGKAQLVEMKKQLLSMEKEISTAIGTHIDIDEVETELEGKKASDLDRRYETLTRRIEETRQRVATLQTRQGELAQEMKQMGEDSRLAVAQLELGCVERQIQSVAHRWQTLATTSAMMDEVCRTFEKERQPETLREASSFLRQLTDGKYTRIWTPLGTSQLRIDGQGKSLPLEVLSRGTREAVFIALRLSLASAYARRGVQLPLILDDVLVNFDHDRAVHAARTLKTFAELGHQVIMFTCHQHITDIFHEIEVEVRMLPKQGKPGTANILMPPQQDQLYDEPEDLYEEEEVVEEVVEELEEPEEVQETETVAEVNEAETPNEEAVEEIVEEVVEEVVEEPKPTVVEEVQTVVENVVPEPIVIRAPVVVTEPRRRKAQTPAKPKRKRPAPPVYEEEIVETNDAGIDWLWYEQSDSSDPIIDNEPDPQRRRAIGQQDLAELDQRMEDDGQGDYWFENAMQGYDADEYQSAPAGTPSDDQQDRSDWWNAGTSGNAVG
ncbi:MAG: hypothetical protein AAFN70_04080, partial [Planctomycetota bacterium]